MKKPPPASGMPSEPSYKPDTLLAGVSLMLVLTVIQRAIGFGRGVWFCRLLDDVSLGKWAMSFAFLSLITPMFLLGLPGSLPRFVETYRQKSQLFPFLTRLGGATIAVVAGGVILLLWFPRPISEFLYGNREEHRLVYALAATFIAIIALNFVDDLLRGLRLPRLSAILQFTQSLAFTVLGVAALWLGLSIPGLVLALGMAALIGLVPAVWGLSRARVIQRNPPVKAFDPRLMWKRLLPYAASIWMMNILSNTFEITDRTMLLHLSPGSSTAGEAAVGQYHSGMLMPTLLFSISLMGSGMLLPYLSADWERGRHRAVHRKMQNALILASVGFTAFGIAAILVSPFLFGQLLNGKFPGAEEILPFCLTLAAWGGLGYVAQNYLFVVEKGKYVTVAMAVGLALNLLLNAVLVPLIGLWGAVGGTAISYLAVLAITLLAMRRCGYRLESTILWILFLPATLPFGWVVAILAILLSVLTNSQIRRYGQQLWNLAGCQFAGFAR